MIDAAKQKDSVLIDFLQTLSKKKSLFNVLHLALNKVSKEVLTDSVRATLIDMFLTQKQAKSDEMNLFELSNGDFAVVYAKEIQDKILALLVRVRFWIQEDAKVAKAADLRDSGLAYIFDLEKDFEKLSDCINIIAQTEVKEEFVDKTTPESHSTNSFFNSTNFKGKQKFTAEMLDKVQKIISVSDFSSFIRRQSICAIIGKAMPQRIFEEVYVSIPDLRDYLLPSVELTSDPWLFLALSETLDKRVLEIISRHDDGALRGNFSININVSTILSDEFLRFDETIDASMKKTIILELQLVDIFSDMRSFDLAKTFASSRGYKICIDGITVDKLKYINRSKLDCDLMKIVWNPQFNQIIRQDEHFMDYKNKAERAKIILCRIDDKNAVEEGNALGISLYQGRYIQRMLGSFSGKTN